MVNKKDITVLPGMEEFKKMNKRKKTTKVKNQISIGTARYANQITGEVEEFTVIQKNVNSDFNFHKVWMVDLLNILNSFGNKKIKLLSFLLGEMRNEDNSISVTYRYISDCLKISYSTVAITMKELTIAGVIKKDKRRNVYMFNPDLLVKGSSGKRQKILIDYINIGTDYHDNDNIIVDENQEEIRKLTEKLESES